MCTRTLSTLQGSSCLQLGHIRGAVDRCVRTKGEPMRRKILILFIAAFTSIFGVTACGGQGDVNEAEQDVKEAEQDVEEAKQEVKVKEAEQERKEAEQKVKEEQQREKQTEQEDTQQEEEEGLDIT